MSNLMSRQRPLSPHLQIYKPQLTSILSILHRGTGVVLSMGSIILVSWIIALTLGRETYLMYSKIINHWFSHLVLLGFTFGLFYHLSNGIRHLFWDAGYGYEISTVYKSGLAVVIISLLSTCLIWYFIMINNA